MLKTFSLILFGLLLFQRVNAQKPDSVSLYMTSGNQILDTKDNADHLLLIMTPPDSSTGTKINQVKEYSLTGKLKLTGNAVINVNNRQLDLKYNGPRIEYFENGRKNSVENFKNGKPEGVFTNYFPDGKLYQVGERVDGLIKLIECRDSTGNILAQNGNGKWVDLDDSLKKVLVQGTVKDSLMEGEWDASDDERVACVSNYKQGAFVSGNYYFKSGKKVPIYAFEVEPKFSEGGPAGFNAYLGRTIKYPDIDKKNGTSGKVIITFVVERNGQLSNVKVLRSPSPTMADVAAQAVQESPVWQPGIQNGKIVRVQYTISFAFMAGG